jgi:hypothetical protein
VCRSGCSSWGVWYRPARSPEAVHLSSIQPCSSRMESPSFPNRGEIIFLRKRYEEKPGPACVVNDGVGECRTVAWAIT